MKIILIIKFILMILSLAVIVFAAIASRMLREKRMNELLPGQKLRRYAPFFDVHGGSIPDSHAGREYASYCRQINVKALIISGIALGVFWLAAVIPT